MSITACAIALQTATTVLQSNDHQQMKNQWAQAYAGYIVIALTALVLALVIWIIFRANARRRSNP